MGYHPIPFHELESLIPSPEPDDGLRSLHDLLERYDWEKDVKPLLELIPPYVADVLDMFRLGKGQVAIGEIFDYSQANISYTRRYAIKRLVWLLTRPKFTDEEIRELVEPYTVETTLNVYYVANYTQKPIRKYEVTPVSKKEQIEIMVLIYKNPNTSRCGRTLQRRSPTVRAYFKKVIFRMLSDPQPSPGADLLRKHFYKVIVNKEYRILDHLIRKSHRCT
jgi:hypothetical protein